MKVIWIGINSYARFGAHSIGWHVAEALRVPDKLTLPLVPPRAPD